ncbi:MAG: DUF1816 domain-containing protein [Synechococcales cyanobacterium]
MTFLKQAMTSLWQGLGLATWIKITTAEPPCTYYFGPFLNEPEAESHQHAFVSDLQAEGAQGIEVVIERGHTPKAFTIESAVPARRH